MGLVETREDSLNSVYENVHKTRNKSSGTSWEEYVGWMEVKLELLNMHIENIDISIDPCNLAQDYKKLFNNTKDTESKLDSKFRAYVASGLEGINYWFKEILSQYKNVGDCGKDFYLKICQGDEIEPGENGLNELNSEIRIANKLSSRFKEEYKAAVYK